MRGSIIDRTKMLVLDQQTITLRNIFTIPCPTLSHPVPPCRTWSHLVPPKFEKRFWRANSEAFYWLGKRIFRLSIMFLRPVEITGRIRMFRTENLKNHLLSHVVAPGHTLKSQVLMRFSHRLRRRIKNLNHYVTNKNIIIDGSVLGILLNRF